MESIRTQCGQCQISILSKKDYHVFLFHFGYQKTQFSDFIHTKTYLVFSLLTKCTLHLL